MGLTKKRGSPSLWREHVITGAAFHIVSKIKAHLNKVVTGHASLLEQCLGVPECCGEIGREDYGVEVVVHDHRALNDQSIFPSR
jgi:hypothetical protein